MNEEIPIANPPLTADEQALVAKLSDTDLAAIDATVLANCFSHWRKVAAVVGWTMDALKNRHPDLPDVFYAQRVSRLVDEGHLDSQGDLSYMRFSEVRLLPRTSNAQ